MAADTLGNSLAVKVTPTNEQERAQVRALGQDVQCVTGQTVKVAFADQGYTGVEPAQAAHDEGIELQVIKLPEAKKGSVLLPRHGVVERSFGQANRFRRFARDYERLPGTLAGLHFACFRYAHAHTRCTNSSKCITRARCNQRADFTDVFGRQAQQDR